MWKPEYRRVAGGDGQASIGNGRPTQTGTIGDLRRAPRSVGNLCRYMLPGPIPYNK